MTPKSVNRLRIGIDVGGTNTDAVVMEGRQVLAAVKAPTTSDVTSGIQDALERVIAQAQVSHSQIGHVMIGTTHFTNAIVERKNLSEVAAIRLGLPAAACLPPMVDWPTDLRAAIGGHRYMLKGGFEYDGRVLSELDVDGLAEIAKEISKKGIGAAAITSIFGPVNDDMERRARDILQSLLPGLDIVLSSQIGRIGLLERESAAIMNAALLDLANSTISAFEGAISTSGLTCGFSITQNDGTLMEADMVRRYPVMTFASGPTNSLRGATFLTNLRNAIVVDVGGTTSDIGILAEGFPRQASSTVDIGGVRTNFRMPDILAIGVGGGSIVAADGTQVGPVSVGHKIASEAMVFGGTALTATDVAVGSGVTNIGAPSRVTNLQPDLLKTALHTIHQQIERGVDRCRVSADPLPVIAVGGGAFLLPDQLGDLEVIRPENASVANAVGAAIAQVSGEVDRIFNLEGATRETAMAAAEDEARNRAIQAGAIPQSIEVVEREDVPLAYLPGNATRIRVRVVGDMEGLL
ncbi:hydantoinase/oxoprolinase N-terminal domain-containing protein [Shimia sp.]|uniref:hydantoinase/oxoprolinase N-terminal domain-containing protein n=1 Tax=Shimia sp. TaxID=1954381 RepID=UPI003B8DE6E7